MRKSSEKARAIVRKVSPQSKAEEKLSSVEKIIAMKDDGATCREICRDLKLPASQVRQVLRLYWVPLL